MLYNVDFKKTAEEAVIQVYQGAFSSNTKNTSATDCSMKRKEKLQCRHLGTHIRKHSGRCHSCDMTLTSWWLKSSMWSDLY